MHHIARGGDVAAKAELLAALRQEMAKAVPAPSVAEPPQGIAIQRAGNLVAWAIGALVAGLGTVLTWALIRRRRRIAARNQAEDAVLAQYYVDGIYNFPIPHELQAGVARRPGHFAKARRIFDNINAFHFRYTGNFVNPRVAFRAHQGDCQTLTGMYQLVADHFRIPFEVGHNGNRLLVDARPIHGRDTRSNTEGRTHWYFPGGHYWAIGAGTEYDLLFMTSPRAPALASNGEAVHAGVTYYTFPGGGCVIEAQPALHYAIQGQGRVFATAAAAIAFINAHP
jgi:hypothetical protein